MTQQGGELTVLPRFSFVLYRAQQLIPLLVSECDLTRGGINSRGELTQRYELIAFLTKVIGTRLIDTLPILTTLIQLIGKCHIFENCSLERMQGEKGR